MGIPNYRLDIPQPLCQIYQLHGWMYQPYSCHLCWIYQLYGCDVSVRLDISAMWPRVGYIRHSGWQQYGCHLYQIYQPFRLYISTIWLQFVLIYQLYGCPTAIEAQSIQEPRECGSLIQQLRDHDRKQCLNRNTTRTCNI